MSLVYHILDKTPAIYPEDMQREYENLAQQLFNSGRVRIDTGYYSNFVRFVDNAARISTMFSIEELIDEDLVKLTKNDIRILYSSNKSSLSQDKRIDAIITDLKKQSKKLLSVSDDLKMRLIRLFVQSAHPIVVRWILLERAQIFITYAHNIGDVMDMASWKTSGQNSGMQSTDGRKVCIYTSCGGDPFAENDKDHPEYGNGWAAVARMQIIAAQEIGHFADIKRDEHGRQITRHAADFGCTKATPHVAAARINDLKKCNALFGKLLAFGMDKLLSLEEQLKFYDNQNLSNFRIFIIRMKAKYYRHILLKKSVEHKLFFVKKFAKEKYMSLMIKLMIQDMKANLAPNADVYKRANKDAEEAIACVEALARVPQQAMKWGYLTTKETMHDLYNVYYHEVIPSLIENYNKLTGTNYLRDYHHNKKSFWANLFGKYKDRIRLVETRKI